MTEPATNSAPATATAQAENGNSRTISTGNNMSDEFQEVLNEIWDMIESNTNAGDLQISRIAIMQPGSPEVASSQPGYKAGQLVDNLTRAILTSEIKPPWLVKKVPEDKLEAMQVAQLIPVIRLPTEYVKWIPKKLQVEGGLQWEFKTTDVSDPRVREGLWPNRGGTYTEPGAPPVTENMNFLCIAIDPESGEPLTGFIVASFSRTSFMSGKKFATFLGQHRMSRMNPWDITYYFWTKREFNQRENSYYYVMNISQGCKLSECPDAAKALKTMAFSMAHWLSDKDEGKSRQEQFINAVQLHQEGYSESNESDSGSPNSSGLDDDPFSKPTATDSTDSNTSVNAEEDF